MKKSIQKMDQVLPVQTLHTGTPLTTLPKRTEINNIFIKNIGQILDKSHS
jgi:hypothetical protein